MMATALRFLGCVHLLAIESLLLGRMVWLPDVTALLVARCALDADTSRAPRLLILLAVARALLWPGGIVFHLWALLVVYLLVWPLRRNLFPERWQFQMLAGGLVAATLSLLQSYVLAGGVGDPLGRGPLGWLLTALVAPGLAIVLAWLPPRRRDKVAATEVAG